MLVGHFGHGVGKRKRHTGRKQITSAIHQYNVCVSLYIKSPSYSQFQLPISFLHGLNRMMCVSLYIITTYLGISNSNYQFHYYLDRFIL